MEKDLQPLIETISNHEIFFEISSIENLKTFAEHHIYAVWDFMCLIKSLQRKLICVETVWHPPENHIGGHLINEIVAEEESDLAWDGKHMSHFEMYVEAMEESGAKTDNILNLIESIKKKKSIESILSEQPIPKIAKDFVTDTFRTIQLKVHQIAASFTFARESITDRMFLPILQNMKGKANVSKFIFYFQRHIDLDAGKHCDEAKKLIVSLCEDNDFKWQEAKEAARDSLISRIAFLDGIHQRIRSNNL